MSSFFTFAFSALLIIIWIIAGGFITQSSVLLHPTRDKDPNLHRAYWYSFWAAFVTWTLVAIFLILIALAIFGVVGLFSTGVGEEATAADYVAGNAESAVTSHISWVTIGFLIVALILVFVTGVLSALCADNIRKSPNYKPTDKDMQKAYHNAIIAASLCLGAGGLLIIGLIAYFIINYQENKKAQEAAQTRALEEQSNQAAVDKLKGDLVKQQLLQQLAVREATVQRQLNHINVVPTSG